MRWPRARPPAAAVPAPRARPHWSWSSSGCCGGGGDKETAPPGPTRRRGDSGGGGGRGAARSGARGLGTPSSPSIPSLVRSPRPRAAREIQWIFFAWFGFASAAGVLLFSWKADEPLKLSFLFSLRLFVPCYLVFFKKSFSNSGVPTIFFLETMFFFLRNENFFLGSRNEKLCLFLSMD